MDPSMQEQNKSLMRQWFERVWNENPTAELVEESIDQMWHKDGIAHYGAESVSGLSLIKSAIRGFQHVCCNSHFEIHKEFAQEDCVFMLLTWRFTTADQTPACITGTVVTRIKDGRIAEAWNHFDFISMLQQMGALPPGALDLALAGEKFDRRRASGQEGTTSPAP